MAESLALWPLEQTHCTLVACDSKRVTKIGVSGGGGVGGGGRPTLCLSRKPPRPGLPPSARSWPSFTSWPLEQTHCTFVACDSKRVTTIGVSGGGGGGATLCLNQKKDSKTGLTSIGSVDPTVMAELHVMAYRADSLHSCRM